MNERITQLAEQADEYAEQTVHYYMGQFDGLTWEGKIKQTRDLKFAELIVAECVGIVDKIVPPGYEDYPDYRDQIEQSFRTECAVEIKKHFGVEE